MDAQKMMLETGEKCVHERVKNTSVSQISGSCERTLSCLLFSEAQAWRSGARAFGSGKQIFGVRLPFQLN